jgi:hypothetical protein
LTAPPRRPDSLPLWARLADLAAILLLVLLAVVLEQGGIRGRFAGVRLSLTNPWRIAMWAGLLVALRHALIRRDPISRRAIRATTTLVRGFVRLARMPLLDDVRAFDEAASKTAGTWRFPVVFLLFVAVTGVMLLPQVRLPTGVRDMGDPLFSTWRLAWVAHQLPRDPLHLFDANIFHPERFTFAYSDSILVPSVAAAPFVWLGVPVLVLYNVLMFATFVLTGVAMFHLVRSLTREVPAAVVSGIAFAFYPFRFEHYSHLELQMTMWIPVVLWCLHRTIARTRVRDGIATGLAVAGQVLSSLYFGIYLVAWLAPIAAVLALGARSVGRSVKPLLVGGAVAALLAMPIALPYLANRQAFGERDRVAVESYSATPRSYLSAHPSSALYGRVLDRHRQPERDLFPGVFVVALALVALVPPVSVSRMAYAAALAFAFEASLGMNGFVYGILYELLVPFRGLRVAARFSIFVGASLAVLAGYGVARLTAHTRPPLRFVLTAALAVAVMIDYRPALDLQPVPLHPPGVYAWFEGRPPSVIAEIPVPPREGDFWTGARYMYFSTFHWNTLLNGDSGFHPPSFREFVERCRTFPDDASLALLKARGAAYVIVHEDGYASRPSYHRTIERIDRRQDLREVRRAGQPGSEARVYEILR